MVQRLQPMETDHRIDQIPEYPMYSVYFIKK